MTLLACGVSRTSQLERATVGRGVGHTSQLERATGGELGHNSQLERATGHGAAVDFLHDQGDVPVDVVGHPRFAPRLAAPKGMHDWGLRCLLPKLLLLRPAPQASAQVAVATTSTAGQCPACMCYGQHRRPNYRACK